MRTVVIGGAGFIGSHLAEYLLDAGDDVTVLDDLSLGRLDNLAACRAHRAFTFQEGSTLDPTAVGRAISGKDRVFHLATAGGARRFPDRPLLGLRSTIHGTETVLDACLDAGAELIVVSSGDIYGKNASGRLSEDADRILGSPLDPRWAGVSAEAMEEAFAQAYWREHGLKVSMVRLFDTVGPRRTSRSGGVVRTLVKQALRGDPLTVHGDGRQTRCFSYVGDVVPAIVRVAEQPAARGLAINLGGTRDMSIVELAERTIRLLGSRSEISFIPYDEVYGPGHEDIPRRSPDIALASRLIRFRPTTTIDTIILKVAKDILSSASNGVHAERASHGVHAEAVH